MIKIFKTFLLASIFPATIFAQNQEFTQPVVKISYLDSIKSTFVNDNLAACVDSLWMNEINSLEIYNQLEKDIATVNLDQQVEYELPTELLKARLKEMDAKSPFHIEYNQSLENLIKSFLKNRKKAYERLMAVSEYYFPLFEDALAKQNVPLEIKYLAVVESALNPKAVSRVGATGLWQFMYQTGKEYNLNIDSYVDDRSDPLKSSAAATQYMVNMYRIFGDWDLVLASYNSGPGNVAKAIRRSGGQQNFWNIRKHLPKETQGYVPAFLATMYIYEYHKEHGINPERAVIKHFETDTVMVKKQLSFKQIASLLDIPVVELQLLNPQYKINVIPAYTDKKHYLRLPKEQIAVFTSNEDKIYAYAQHEIDLREKPYNNQQAYASRTATPTSTSKTKYYKVRRGDSLGKIANKYDVSVSDLKSWNKLRSNTVAVGKSLKIRIEGEEEVLVHEPKPIKTMVVEKEAVADSQSGNSKVYKEEKVITYKNVTKNYKVKSGDNLGEISSKYDVSVADIKKWNNLKGSTISVGQNIKINSNERVVTTIKKEIKSENIAVADKNQIHKSDSLSVNTKYYVVQKGDNLSTIAKKNSMTVEELKALNNLESNTINLESKLKINQINSEDDVKEVAVSNSQKQNSEYIVQKGDSLFSIAKKHPGITISDIKKWNGIKDGNLKPGMKLKING